MPAEDEPILHSPPKRSSAARDALAAMTHMTDLEVDAEAARNYAATDVTDDRDLLTRVGGPTADFDPQVAEAMRHDAIMGALQAIHDELRSIRRLLEASTPVP